MAKGVEYAANAKRAKRWAAAQALFDARNATQQAASLLALATDDRNNPATSFFIFFAFPAQISEK